MLFYFYIFYYLHFVVECIFYFSKQLDIYSLKIKQTVFRLRKMIDHFLVLEKDLVCSPGQTAWPNWISNSSDKYEEHFDLVY